MRAIILFTLAATSAVAHADPWSIGIEPRIGAMLPTSKLGANVTGGVEFDVATPVADHQLTIGLDASFARPSYSSSAMSTQLPSTIDYTVQQLEVLVGLTANYRFLRREPSARAARGRRSARAPAPHDGEHDAGVRGLQ